MSSERYQSPVWDDVIRVWTARQAFALDLKREGRGTADWLLIVLLYFLSFSFSYLVGDWLGEQHLWDKLFDSPSEPKSGSQAVFGFAVVSLGWVIACSLQWLVLPRLSGWFGGSYYRPDVNLAYYASFAIGFIPEFVSFTGTALSLLIEKFTPPWGAYFYPFFWVVSLAVTLHWASHVWRDLLGLPSYARALGLTLVSLIACLGAVLLIFYGLYLIFPELADYL